MTDDPFDISRYDPVPRPPRTTPAEPATVHCLTKERAVRDAKKYASVSPPAAFGDWFLTQEVLIERTQKHLKELGEQSIAQFGAKRWLDMLDVERMMALHAEAEGK